MEAPKKQAEGELPSEIKGLQGRLRYAIETRLSENGDLSQNKIAEMAEVDSGNLSGYLAGTRLAGIRALTIIRLARALRVSVNWLLLGVEPSGLGAEATPIPRSAIREITDK